jgi:3-keto-disaccharide hydrolase
MRCVAIALLSGMVVLSAQQPAPPAPQQPAAGQPPAGAPGAPAQGRGRGGGGFRQPDPIDFQEHEGWTSLFDGKTLNGWSGDNNWKVEDGAITIESTCEKPTGTIYLVWQGGEAADFELKLEMKGTGSINGGVQYRGWIAPPPQRGGGAGRAGQPGAGGAPGAGAPAPAAAGAAPPPAAAAPAPGPQAAGGPPPGVPGAGRGNQGPCPSGDPRGTPPDPKTEVQWNMWGPQYDFDAGNRFTGQFYEQSTGRGIVAWKGQVVRTEKGKNPRLVATLGEPAVIDSYYKPNDWNELHIIAIGNQMTHILNGHILSVLIDEDPTYLRKSGALGLEVEATGKLFTRNIWLKKLN